jgi:electron transport complex protein RnfB
MNDDPYRQLAQRLDALPNGFPSTESGTEIRLLQKLCSPEEAALVAQLRLTPETVSEIAVRVGGDRKEVSSLLRDMTRKGLIRATRTDEGIKFQILPFAVGIFEMQIGRMDAEMAQLFEDYYQDAFGEILQIQPPLHRVIPIKQSVQAGTEIRPFESAVEIIERAQSWGVVDCICRKQRALVGEPCDHPLDVCMVMNEMPGAFDRNPHITAQSREEALATLKKAADAGLVHSVSNNQEGLWYICNCCTCSCEILRGMVKIGTSNVVARSAFVNLVDEDLCVACGICEDACPFDALEVGDLAVVDEVRCVGCGVCVASCPEGALSLTRRPEEEVLPVPVTEMDWMTTRAKDRGIDLNEVL